MKNKILSFFSLILVCAMLFCSCVNEDLEDVVDTETTADTEAVPKPESAMAELLKMLPEEGQRIVSEDLDGEVIEYLENGTMLMTHAHVHPPPPPPEQEVGQDEAEEEPVMGDGPDPLDFADTETENDPAEVTLTDFMETTDSEVVDWKSIISKIPEKLAPVAQTPE